MNFNNLKKASWTFAEVYNTETNSTTYFVYNPEHMTMFDGHILQGGNSPQLEELLKDKNNFSTELPSHIELEGREVTHIHLMLQKTALEQKIQKVQEAIPPKRNFLWYLLHAKTIIELIIAILQQPNPFKVKRIEGRTH